MGADSSMLALMAKEQPELRDNVLSSVAAPSHLPLSSRKTDGLTLESTRVRSPGQGDSGHF